MGKAEDTIFDIDWIELAAASRIHVLFTSKQLQSAALPISEMSSLHAATRLGNIDYIIILFWL